MDCNKRKKNHIHILCGWLCTVDEVWHNYLATDMMKERKREKERERERERQREIWPWDITVHRGSTCTDCVATQP